MNFFVLLETPTSTVLCVFSDAVLSVNREGPSMITKYIPTRLFAELYCIVP